MELETWECHLSSYSILYPVSSTDVILLDTYPQYKPCYPFEFERYHIGASFMNDRVKTVFADFANKCLTITNVDIIFESGILSMGKVEESGVIKVVVNVEDDLEIVSTLSFLLRVTKSDSSRNRNCKHLDWNELDHRVDISDRHGWLILNSICGEDVSVLIKEELPEYYGAVRKILLTLIRKRYNAALERYIYVMGNGDPKSPGGKRTWRTIGSDEGLAVLC